MKRSVSEPVKRLHEFRAFDISADEPTQLSPYARRAACRIGDGEFLSLSHSADLQHTRDVFNRRKGIAGLPKDSFPTRRILTGLVEPTQQRITWDPIMAEKGGFKHFMLKEIYEQPRAVRDTVRGRVSLDSGKVYLEQMNISEDEFKQINSVTIVACGTSWHAGIAGKYMIEQLARVPVEVDYASEFRYRNPVLDENTLLIVISQSGETADTIAAMREAKKYGCKALAVCNVQGSMIHREADGTILTHAGPEIGVASTKAFTSQMIALYLFALYLGQLRGKLDEAQAKHHAQQLAELPLKIEHLLSDADSIEELSREFFRSQDFLYLGRGINFPVALEGALKLKEISYIHAEGYPAGEMKHGPNALIDEKLPVVVVNTREEGNAASELRYEKTHSNIVEVKARDGIVVSILTENDEMSSRVSDHVIEIPAVSDLLAPILSIVPLQLLAYHIAVRRGCDVDQPRNLAKSVTVE